VIVLLTLASTTNASWRYDAGCNDSCSLIRRSTRPTAHTSHRIKTLIARLYWTRNCITTGFV